RGRADQIPRARFEAVLTAGQGADRAQLDGVAGEDGIVGFAVQRGDFTVGPALDGRQRLVARDLLVESYAAVAHDAALAIEDDAVAQRKGFVLVALFLGE